MSLILFQRCGRHATKEKMRAGTKERLQGMVREQVARPVESSKSKDVKIALNISHQQSRQGFLSHGLSQAKESPRF